MKFYIELQKNTQTHCVKQMKEFDNYKEANEYFKNTLLEIEPEDRGFVEFGKILVYYEFKEDLNKLETFRIEKEGLKNNDSLIENNLILNPYYDFSLNIYKIKVPKAKIKF